MVIGVPCPPFPGPFMPLPWCSIILGAAINSGNGLTWDCWKQVFRDESTAPSKGVALEDLLLDGRVKSIDFVDHSVTKPIGLSIEGQSELVVTNVWGEHFHIHYVAVPAEEGKAVVAAHAIKMATDEEKE